MPPMDVEVVREASKDVVAHSVVWRCSTAPQPDGRHSLYSSDGWLLLENVNRMRARARSMYARVTYVRTYSYVATYYVAIASYAHSCAARREVSLIGVS